MLSEIPKNNQPDSNIEQKPLDVIRPTYTLSEVAREARKINARKACARRKEICEEKNRSVVQAEIERAHTSRLEAEKSLIELTQKLGQIPKKEVGGGSQEIKEVKQKKEVKSEETDESEDEPETPKKKKKQSNKNMEDIYSLIEGMNSKVTKMWINKKVKAMNRVQPTQIPVQQQPIYINTQPHESERDIIKKKSLRERLLNLKN